MISRNVGMRCNRVRLRTSGDCRRYNDMLFTLQQPENQVPPVLEARSPLVVAQLSRPSQSFRQSSDRTDITVFIITRGDNLEGQTIWCWISCRWEPNYSRESRCFYRASAEVYEDKMPANF